MRKINDKIILIDKNRIALIKSYNSLSINNLLGRVELLKFNHDLAFNDLINLINIDIFRPKDGETKMQRRW